MLSEVAGDGALTHGQRLPGDIERALAAAGITLDDLDLLAVVAGPGSFTGLRIGIAAIQGLAFARALRVVPVSAFEAIGRLTLRSAPEALLGVWIDAQRGEVFATLYDGAISRVRQPPSSARPDATLASWADALASRRILFSGDGAIRYKETIAGTLGSRATVQEPAPLLAAEAARIAAEHPDRAGPPHAIVPIYIRRPDVELSRSRAGR